MIWCEKWPWRSWGDAIQEEICPDEFFTSFNVKADHKQFMIQCLLVKVEIRIPASDFNFTSAVSTPQSVLPAAANCYHCPTCFDYMRT